MATPNDGRLVSLDAVWEEFDASAIHPDGDDGAMQLTTKLTLTLPDGRAAEGTLVLCHYDTTPPGKLNVEFYFNPAGRAGLLYVAPMGEDWTKERLIAAFNVAPDSPIWTVEVAPDMLHPTWMVRED
jgi:hypothetical protein